MQVSILYDDQFAVLIMSAVRHLPLSDHIIVLGSDGRTSEQGSFDNLRSKDGFVSKIIRSPEILQSKPDGAQRSEIVSKPRAPPTARNLQGPTANDAADLNRRIGDTSVYKYYLRAIGWKIALVNVSGAVVWMLGANFPRGFFDSLQC